MWNIKMNTNDKTVLIGQSTKSSPDEFVEEYIHKSVGNIKDIKKVDNHRWVYLGKDSIVEIIATPISDIVCFIEMKTPITYPPLTCL